MNEKKYTGNYAKKFTSKEKASKLKSEASARKSYRKKLRYGKKDNTLTVEDARKLRRMKKQGRKKIYKETVAANTVRNAGNQNEDKNGSADSLNAGITAAEVGMGKIRAYGMESKYAAKIHKRTEQTAQRENNGPEQMSMNNVKMSRKKLMQREFAEAAAQKQRKEAANGAGSIGKKFTDKAEDLAGRLAEWIRESVAEHPLFLVSIAAIMIVVLIVSGSLTSCSALGSLINNTTLASSFTAEDADIRQVEADYIALETELQKKVDHVKRDHPGYDEYNFTLAEISHNPFELAALLTVLYENYTPAQVQSMLQTIFDYQYKLTFEEIVETRTRIETRTGHKWVSDGEVDGVSTGHMESYEYEVEVEYEYYILNTTLTNNGITAAVNGLNLTQEQMERYRLLLEMRGNKPEIFGDNVYANPGVSEEYERYAVPGEYLTDQQFANLLHEAEKYLGYPYVWGGASPSTSFDCSGFVSYVINHSGNGWNYGRLTANGWKNATARVAASDVRAGDLVFFQGTYNTSGASHVGIVVDPVKKIMIHCGNPIQYASYDTAYWRAHAYCYGRIQ
jgi:cell wall-associated NlpC family hydrolase